MLGKMLHCGEIQKPLVSNGAKFQRAPQVRRKVALIDQIVSEPRLCRVRVSGRGS